MSARRHMTGPLPFSRSATTPVLPMQFLTFNPRASISWQTILAVRVSWNESSGCRCKSRRISTRSSAIILDRSSKFNLIPLGYIVAGVKTDQLACFNGSSSASRKADIAHLGNWRTSVNHARR